MNILITDGNTRPALAIVRSLGKRGDKIFVCEKKNIFLAGNSKYCYQSFVYPDPAKDTDRFIDIMIQIIKEYKIDVVLPVTDITTLSVTENKKEIEQYCSVPFADFKTIDFVSNKYKIMKLAQEMNIPIPETIFIYERIQINSLSKGLKYPLVIKPHRSRIKANNKWISTSVQYADNFEELKNITEEMDNIFYPIMIQERIIGPGIGVFVCYKKGKLVAHFSHRRIREKPPSGGVSVLCESTAPLPLALEYSERILNRLEWHGVAMMEFKLDKSDDLPKLMEVNGRFWGSLQLAIRSGVDFPKILVDGINKEQNIKNYGYRINIKNRWLWGDIDSLLVVLLKKKDKLNLPIGHKRKLISFISFLKFYGTGLYYEVLSFNDIRPWLYETIQRLRKNKSKDLHADKLKGLFHVHSNYSYDGKCTLKEFVEFCEIKQFSFIMMTEHAEDFNESKMESYVRECDNYSNEKVNVIPGLEFNFEKYPDLHLLGVGIRKYFDAKDISCTIKEIHRQNGLAVIAHPAKNNHYVPEEIVKDINGLEIWNAAYDSRFLPNHKSLKLYKNLKGENHSLIAFSGLDMHDIHNFRELTLFISGRYKNGKELLGKIREGQFVNKGKLLTFQSKLKISFITYVMILASRLVLHIADYFYWTICRQKANIIKY